MAARPQFPAQDAKQTGDALGITWQTFDLKQMGEEADAYGGT
jgi:hypothetical protein